MLCCVTVLRSNVISSSKVFDVESMDLYLNAVENSHVNDSHCASLQNHVDTEFIIFFFDLGCGIRTLFNPVWFREHLTKLVKITLN